jgi:hypothetical protein
VRITLRCPHCRQAVDLDSTGSDSRPCPACGKTLTLHLTESMRRDNAVDRCAVCDCPQVYVQKDFNRRLGVSIFLAGAVASLVLYGFHRVLEAAAILLGCALVDALLYRVLPDVAICYHCHSQYRGYVPHARNQPFALGLAEKYDPKDPAPSADNPATAWHER